MKKKRNCLLTLLLSLLLLFTAAPAGADVIFEPLNDFYTSHSEECLYYQRSYLLPEKTAYFSAPGGTASGSLDKDTSLWISWLYRDREGRDWGYFEQYEPERSGWLPMADLLLVYDSREFLLDHARELTDHTESLPMGKPVVFWTYPMSGVISGHIDHLDHSLETTVNYTDPEGRIWGLIGYYQGDTNVWVCLSDPANQEIPSGPQPQPKTYGAPEELTELSGVSYNPDLPPVESSGSVSWPLIGLSIAAVCIAALLLLKIFWKKQR